MADKWLVDIKDFQSIKNAHLEFVPGINIIVGKTNAGKSAIFRAIDSCTYNLGDDSMIRSGQRYCGVSISNEKHKVVFMRDGKGKNEKTKYQFDGGNTQSKVGRGQLAEVAQMLNVRDIRMPNGTKTKINFWYQNDKPFLMDKTPGQLYEFLSLSSCDNYARVLRTMEADSKVLKADIANVTTEIDTLKLVNNRKNDFINANDGYDEVYKSVVIASHEQDKMDDIKFLIDFVSNQSNIISSRISMLSDVESGLSKIPFDDVTEIYSELSKGSNWLNEVLSSISNVRDIKSRLEGMSDSLNGVNTSFSLLSSGLNDVSDKLDDANKSLLKVKETADTIDSISDLNSKLGDIRNRISYYDSLISGVDFNSLSGLIDGFGLDTEFVRVVSGLIDSVLSVKGTIDSNNLVLTSLSKDYDNSVLKLNSYKKEIGCCPYCGAIFDDNMEVCIDG